MGVCNVNEQLWLLQSSSSDYNLVVLTSLPFENCPEKKKQVERFRVKTTVCNFSLRAKKWIVGSRPNTCHSPWWAVCLETAFRPKLRSLTSPELPQASEKQMRKRERRRGKKKNKKALLSSVFLNRFCVMQDDVHTFVLLLLWLLLWLTLTGTTSAQTIPTENGV